MEQIQNFVRELQGAAIFRTPDKLVQYAQNYAYGFSYPNNNEVWQLVCQQLGINPENSDALNGRKFLYHPDIGCNSPVDHIRKRIVSNLHDIRDQIADLLTEKGAHCILVDQTEYAAFLNMEKHRTYRFSTQWAKVKNHDGITIKFKPTLANGLSKEYFCFEEEPIQHPHVIPEWHAFFDGKEPCLVSVAPDYSNIATLYHLFKKYAVDKQDWKKHLLEILYVFRDALQAYEETNAQYRVSNDNKSSNIMAVKKEGRLKGLAFDSSEALKAGAPLNTEGIIYTTSYSEIGFYVYDMQCERYSYATDVFSAGCTLLELISQDQYFWWTTLTKHYKSFKDKKLTNQERESMLFKLVEETVNNSALPDRIKPGVTALIQSMLQCDRLSRPQFDTVIQIFDKIIEAMEE